MQTLQVDLGSRTYPIFIGTGILNRADCDEHTVMRYATGMIDA